MKTRFAEATTTLLYIFLSQYAGQKKWLRRERTTHFELILPRMSTLLIRLIIADCEYKGLPYNKVVTKSLYLLVLDYNRFGRDDPIGEVCLPLGDLDLAAGLTMWKTLMPCKESVVSCAHYVHYANCYLAAIVLPKQIGLTPCSRRTMKLLQMCAIGHVTV
jgi:hypothetical protein